ncbi:MAG TPA: Ig-like domain-containing protein, partial [Pseudomonadales bacterium]|nr:Ig-like domain-containing protein [Pseudomonadales bacterium]
TTLNHGAVLSVGDLANVIYKPAANNHGSDSFSYTSTDGFLNTLNSATVSISIAAVNDAPVLVAGDYALASIVEDVTEAANSGTLVADLLLADSITDVDGTVAKAIAVTSINNTYGVWQYKLANGAWANISTTTGGVVNLGSSALLLDANASLRFVPNADYNGSSSIDFRAWDQTTGTVGGTFDPYGVGGNTTLSRTVDSATITITPTNDQPTSADLRFTMNEDTSYIFKVADFAFNDIDTGDTLDGISILTMPSAGALKLDGTEVSAGAIVSAADIAAGKLTYTPTADAFGSEYASFTFTVSDGEVSSVSQTVTIDVTDTNDAPTAVAWQSGGSVAEGANEGTVVGKLVATDPNSGDTLRFGRVSNPNFVVALDGTISVAQGALLDFESTPNQTLRVKVTDAGGLSYEQDVTVTLTDVVEVGPSLVVRAFYIAKGASVTITTENLLGTDVGQPGPETLAYTVNANTAGGTFYLDVDGDNVVDEGEELGVYNEANPNARDTFTPQDVIDGKLKFIKDNTQTAGRLTVTLSDGNTQQDVQGTLVAMVSSPPVLSAEINDQEWNVTGEQSFSLSASTFTDPDFDVLTWSATLADDSALPSWLSFDASTRTFSGNPADAGIANGQSISIKVSATDGRNTPATDTFDLTFSETPTKPQVANPMADITLSGAGNKSFAIPAGTFSDPNGDTFTYSATIPAGISSWLSFNAATQTFSGNPPAGAVPGPYTITITGTANGDSVSNTFKLWVLNANDAPTGNVISDWTISGAAEVTKDINVSSFSDGDGDALELTAYLLDSNGNDTELPSWLTFAYDDAN